MFWCAGSLNLEEHILNGSEHSEEEAAGSVATSEEHLLTGHSGAVVCVAMHEDRLLFTGSTDCTIKVCSPVCGFPSRLHRRITPLIVQANHVFAMAAELLISDSPCIHPIGSHRVCCILYVCLVQAAHRYACA